MPAQGEQSVPKKYRGERTIDGLRVTVNGAPLSVHTEVRKFTDYGFEWSYEGESPQQLALAILVDFLDDPNEAERLSGPFMKSVIANLDNDWELNGAQISTALEDMRKR